MSCAAPLRCSIGIFYFSEACSLNIKAVLFDLDGTLVNTLEDLAFGVNLVLAGHGFPTHPTDAFKFFAGNGIPVMVRRALPEGTDDETGKLITDEFLAYYSKHYADRSYAYDGIVELVGELKKRGLLTAVITNKADEVAQVVIEKCCPADFDMVLGKREGIPSKPDPTSARLVMETLGVSPEECIFVGDTGTDVSTGVNCGAYPVGVLWGFRDESELIKNGAKEIIGKPVELLGVIDRLNGDEKNEA